VHFRVLSYKPKYCLKNAVFSDCRKVFSVSFLRSCGSEFQTVGPATENARRLSVYVDSAVGLHRTREQNCPFTLQNYQSTVEEKPGNETRYNQASDNRQSDLTRAKLHCSQHRSIQFNSIQFNVFGVGAIINSITTN